MKAPAFTYVRPSSLDETFEFLDCYGEEAKILAGGQSLIAALNMRLAAPKVLIDISRLPGLSGIHLAGDTITVGALTRHCDVETSTRISQYVPMLAAALPHVAHTAVRNRGTFGGSIAYADPAAELPACSVALEAQFVIANRNGKRRVSAGDFFKGLYETALAPGELLIAGEFPVLKPNYRSAFQELSRRRGDYAIVGLAAHAKSADGRLSNVRLAFFGVGATPVLARGASAVLEGKIKPETIVAAQAALGGDLEPYDDIHSSAAMRLHLARVLLGRVVGQLSGQQ